MVQMIEQSNPSFLLGQLVGTSQLLHDVVATLNVTVDHSTFFNDIPPDLDSHALCLLLLQRELAPYEPYLKESGKESLLEDMKRIHALKVKYDFEQEELDKIAYDQGYQHQLEKYAALTQKSNL